MSDLYKQIFDGERHVVSRDRMNMCCDCGLVHFIRLRVVKRGKRTILINQVWRMSRSTAAARLGKRYRGLRLPKA
jgi:hypothetical protein